MKLEQAALQALDAMEEGLIDAKWYAAKDALREALAEQAEQEPVAYNPSPTCIKHIEGMPVGTPLYAAPVRTKNLTDGAIWEILETYPTDILKAMRAVIAADREKNK